jgi:hypothetical protein
MENKHGLFHKKISIKDAPFEAVFSPVVTFSSDDDAVNAKLAEYGIEGEYSDMGIFNDHPIYSNGKTKWVWLDPEIEPEITTPGYYLMDEPVLELSGDDVIDLTEEIKNFIPEEEN